MGYATRINRLEALFRAGPVSSCPACSDALLELRLSADDGLVVSECPICAKSPRLLIYRPVVGIDIASAIASSLDGSV